MINNKTAATGTIIEEQTASNAENEEIMKEY